MPTLEVFAYLYSSNCAIRFSYSEVDVPTFNQLKDIIVQGIRAYVAIYVPMWIFERSLLQIRIAKYAKLCVSLVDFRCIINEIKAFGGASAPPPAQSPICFNFMSRDRVQLHIRFCF